MKLIKLQTKKKLTAEVFLLVEKRIGGEGLPQLGPGEFVAVAVVAACERGELLK